MSYRDKYVQRRHDQELLDKLTDSRACRTATRSDEEPVQASIMDPAEMHAGKGGMLPPGRSYNVRLRDGFRLLLRD